MRRKTYGYLALGVWLLGSIMLAANSEIEDLALALISVGGVMTIWFKLGSLESTVSSMKDRMEKLDQRLENTSECMQKLQARLSVMEGRADRYAD